MIDQLQTQQSPVVGDVNGTLKEVLRITPPGFRGEQPGLFEMAPDPPPPPIADLDGKVIDTVGLVLATNVMSANVDRRQKHGQYMKRLVQATEPYGIRVTDVKRLAAAINQDARGVDRYLKRAFKRAIAAPKADESVG